MCKGLSNQTFHARGGTACPLAFGAWARAGACIRSRNLFVPPAMAFEVREPGGLLAEEDGTLHIRAWVYSLRF